MNGGDNYRWSLCLGREELKEAIFQLLNPQKHFL